MYNAYKINQVWVDSVDNIISDNFVIGRKDNLTWELIRQCDTFSSAIDYLFDVIKPKEYDLIYYNCNEFTSIHNEATIESRNKKFDSLIPTPSYMIGNPFVTANDYYKLGGSVYHANYQQILPQYLSGNDNRLREQWKLRYEQCKLH